ncbi:hypothetical protein ABT116_43095, partial [Streptomyces sp. NPDC002130]|uniref:hypothetical protein n=1 Tax=Streptomyces sp. NPDC002130 TaxID=3155568 RepID=UPI00331B2BDC
MTSTTRTELAAQAYIYGFPLVFNLDQVHRYVHLVPLANARWASGTWPGALTVDFSEPLAKA